MKRSAKSTYLGLDDRHRIGWNDPVNRVCITLARLGFSIQTIAKNTGLTECQVIYRCSKKNLHVTDYRNGTSVRALSLLHKHTSSLVANSKTAS